MKKLIKKAAQAAIKPFPPVRRAVRSTINIRKKHQYRKIKKQTPTDPETIIFESFMGRSYSDSPRAIYEYMLTDKKFQNYKFIWALKNPENAKKTPTLKKSQIVKYGSQEYYKAYARSAVWITNSRLPEYLQPASDQKYIQNWHGTPLKRLGHDIKVAGANAMNTKRELREKYDNDSKRYTAMVSPSPFVTKCYRSAFNLAQNNPNCEIWEVGYPRNDRLVNATQKEIASLKKQLDLPANKKIILYAPTWRDDQHQAGTGYTYKNEMDFDLLQKLFGDTHIILFRPHYFIANAFNFARYKGFVRNVADIDDINDLYLISDILVTDYSSVFFDFSILQRPIIFYMYDLEKYRDLLHGFYISLETLPGPITTTMPDFIAELQNLPKIDKKYQAFLKKYTPLEDGKASQRVAERIQK